MPALTPDNDIFISYSRIDISRIKPAISILKASGADVFVDTEDIEYGEEWRKALDTNIKEAERIFVFWSKHSAESVEVKKEYQKAIELGSVLIIPVMLDETPLPEDLAKYQGVTEFGSLLQQATRVNEPLKIIYRYGLPALALFLLLFAGMIFIWSSRSARVYTASNTSNSVGIYPQELPVDGNTENTNSTELSPPLPPPVKIPPVRQNNNNKTGKPRINPNNDVEPRTRPTVATGNVESPTRNTSSNGNLTPSAPNPTTPIQARAEKEEEPPASETLPLAYPLILILSIIMLTVIPATYLWARKRKRLIKAVRAELFPQAK